MKALASNVVEVVGIKPRWYHVWLLAQVVFIMKYLLWSVGQPISFLIVALTIMWMIAVTQKF